MTIDTGSVAKDLVTAAQLLHRNSRDLSSSDLKLIRFAEDHLKPLLAIRDAEIPSKLPGDEELLDQATADWPQPSDSLTAHERAVEGRKHSPDDYSFNILEREADK